MNARASATNRSESGFTLLELLIAIVLLSLITTMLMAGLRLETQSLSRQTARLDRAAQLPPVYDFLRAQFADAQPVIPIGASSRSIVFDGETESVHFVSTGPLSSGIGGLQLLSVALVDGALRVRWRTYDGRLPDADQPGTETVLLDDIIQAHFSFFGIVPPDTAAHWHDTWQDMPYLPSLIRLSLTSADGLAIPEFTVKPRVTAPEPPARGATEASTR